MEGPGDDEGAIDVLEETTTFELEVVGTGVDVAAVVGTEDGVAVLLAIVDVSVELLMTVDELGEDAVVDGAVVVTTDEGVVITEDEVGRTVLVELDVARVVTVELEIAV